MVYITLGETKHDILAGYIAEPCVNLIDFAYLAKLLRRMVWHPSVLDHEAEIAQEDTVNSPLLNSLSCKMAP